MFDLGKWVKDARTAADMTQEALGAALGMTKGNISNIENGRTSPSFENVIKIAKLTNAPLPIINQNISEPHNHGSGTQNNVIGTQNNFLPESSGSLKTMQMPDDSFAPLIPQGSELTYNTSDTSIKNGKIYLIQQGEQVFIRRAFPQLSGSLKWACENPAFGADELPPNAVQIVGRVVRWAVED